MDKMLDGRVAIVTGAGRGIGASIARRLAAGGARTIINFRSSPDEADAVVGAIEKAGGTAMALKADVGRSNDAAALFDEGENAFGTVDLLVNNATMRGNSTPAHEIDVDAYQEIFAANVCGPLLMMAEFARRNAAGGAIVNMSSGQSRTPMLNTTLYPGTKGAIEAITRACAADFGPRGIRVNAVSPGATATDRFKDAVPDDVKMRTIDNTALGRLGEPDDIADVVAFLLTHDARWMTGQIVDIDGGLRR